MWRTSSRTREKKKFNPESKERERERVRKLFVRERVKKENLISVKLFCSLQLKNYRKIVQRSNLNKWVWCDKSPSVFLTQMIFLTSNGYVDTLLWMGFRVWISAVWIHYCGWVSTYESLLLESMFLFFF